MQYAATVSLRPTALPRLVEGGDMEDVPRFAVNLKRYREDAGLNRQQLARLIGVDPGLITRYEQGKVKNPGAERLAALAGVLGVGVRELIELDAPPPAPRPPTGESIDDRIRRLELIVGQPTATAHEGPTAVPLFPRDARVVRHFGRASADPTSGAARLEASASADEFTLIAVGDCLAPEIEDGDYLLLHLDRRPNPGQVVAVDVHGELHLKRVIQRSPGTLFLTSRRGDLRLPEEGVEVLGVVEKIARIRPSNWADLVDPIDPPAPRAVDRRAPIIPTRTAADTAAGS
jgi:transcriptional regulator with XRE-family HTH domain